MNVSQARSIRLALPESVGWTVAGAGALAVFATYWDEAWHTDVGRDSAWAAPHVLLYGSVGVVGLGIAFWGLRVLALTRSLRLVLAHASLLAAGMGALGALAAAPIDALWHETYGRDAVLWSPPHMLVVLASTTLTLGVLAGLPPSARALRVAVGVLLLANAATVVFEYEADVPQFSEVLYLPLLLLVGLPVVWLIREFIPVPAPATTVVLGYVMLRLAVALGLVLVGRSAPDLPVAVIGLAAYDLPLRNTISRLGAATAATSALAWSASALALASPAATAVALAALPLGLLALLVLILSSRKRWVLGAVLPLSGLASMVTANEAAEAHDPGQGPMITSVSMRVVTEATGEVRITITSAEHCNDLTAERVVARRAGETVSGRLEKSGRCIFDGRLTLPGGGRWFVYAEFDHGGSPAESWVPVEGMSVHAVDTDRLLYVPAGNGDAMSAGQVTAGGFVYAAGLTLLYIGIRAKRVTAAVPLRTGGERRSHVCGMGGL